MYEQQDFTIVERPYAHVISDVTSLLQGAGIRNAIVGGLATQLNILYSAAQDRGVISYDPMEQDMLEGTGVEPTPIINVNDVSDLESVLRPTHDLDLCADNNDESGFLTALTQGASEGFQVHINGMKPNGYRKLTVHSRAVKGSKPISLGVDYNVCAEDSYARVHRDKEAYEKVLNEAHQVGLAFNGQVYHFTFVRPHEIVTGKLVRGKPKDLEDVETLIQYCPVNLAEVRRRLEEGGEGMKMRRIARDENLAEVA